MTIFVKQKKEGPTKFPLCNLWWSPVCSNLWILPQVARFCDLKISTTLLLKNMGFLTSSSPRTASTRPWRGSAKLWSNKVLPLPVGYSRRWFKLTFKSAMDKLKYLVKRTPLYHSTFCFYFTCRIWFWLPLVHSYCVPLYLEFRAVEIKR